MKSSGVVVVEFGSLLSDQYMYNYRYVLAIVLVLSGENNMPKPGTDDIWCWHSILFSFLCVGRIN